MSTWLSESEFRQAGAEAIGVTINVAFLQEIKEDFGFRETLNETYRQLSHSDEGMVSAHVAAQLLSDVRDELETYFALEEFYGYFDEAAIANPSVCQSAETLRDEHQTLYLELDGLVERALQIAYREVNDGSTVESIFESFEQFCKRLAHHEHAEMELMMRLCNEDIGVGD